MNNFVCRKLCRVATKRHIYAVFLEIQEGCRARLFLISSIKVLIAVAVSGVGEILPESSILGVSVEQQKKLALL
jgi:hypothetical protein